MREGFTQAETSSQGLHQLGIILEALELSSAESTDRLWSPLQIYLNQWENRAFKAAFRPARDLPSHCCGADGETETVCKCADTECGRPRNDGLARESTCHSGEHSIEFL